MLETIKLNEQNGFYTHESILNPNQLSNVSYIFFKKVSFTFESKISEYGSNKVALTLT